MDKRTAARVEREIKERRDQSLLFMRNADVWPLWPRLPIKRQRPQDIEAHGGLGELGVLLESPQWIQSEAIPVVHLCTIFDNPLHGRVETITYQSLEELVDDGWVVD